MLNFIEIRIYFKPEDTALAYEDAETIKDMIDDMMNEEGSSFTPEDVTYEIHESGSFKE